MRIKFWKMHGAQNDFVLIDDRAETFPAGDRALIAKLSARCTGIGAEGLLLLQRSETADFRMRFFNPDGGEASMCGNGARCAARLAFELGMAGPAMSIETGAGELQARMLPAGVLLHMTDPFGWRLEMSGHSLTYSFVNTGVPHAVLRTGDLRDVDVSTVGSAVRHHGHFAPDGTNVNFMEVERDGLLAVRTYERGVEDETRACGTGVTACGLIAARHGWVLVVGGDLTSEGACNVTLTGPAEHVFEGTIDCNEVNHGD
jgi:diaminopimelate epimerase